jgi:hypothetical protein
MQEARLGNCRGARAGECVAARPRHAQPQFDERPRSLYQKKWWITSTTRPSHVSIRIASS